MTAINIQPENVSIAFDSAPLTPIRNELKSMGFQWDPINSVWNAPYSQEREALVRRLASHPNTRPITTAAVPTIDAEIERILLTEDSNRRAELLQSLEQRAVSNIDSYVQAIRFYKQIEEDAISEKKEKEAAIKDEVDAIIQKKKVAEQKRLCIERLITKHMVDTGEAVLNGGSYNASLQESISYKVSPELEREIRARAGIPDWLTMELKVNQRAVKEMADVPEGLVETSEFKVQTWTETEGDPNVKAYKKSLKAFLDGATIREIADKRALSWKTVKSHLLTAIDSGELDIRRFVPNSMMLKLDELRNANPEMGLSGFSEAINGEISYDWISLTLTYLGRRS